MNKAANTAQVILPSLPVFIKLFSSEPSYISTMRLTAMQYGKTDLKLQHQFAQF